MKTAQRSDAENTGWIGTEAIFQIIHKKTQRIMKTTPKNKKSLLTLF